MNAAKRFSIAEYLTNNRGCGKIFKNTKFKMLTCLIW